MQGYDWSWVCFVSTTSYFIISAISISFTHTFHALWCTLYLTIMLSKTTLLPALQLSGHFSQRLFRKLPPRVCVPLKNIVSEEFLRAGSVCVRVFTQWVCCHYATCLIQWTEIHFVKLKAFQTKWCVNEDCWCSCSLRIVSVSTDAPIQLFQSQYNNLCPIPMLCFPLINKYV